MQPVILAQSPMLTKPVDLRQVAVRYVNNHIGDAFTVGKLRLQQDQQKWWALIQYQAKGQYFPIGVGRVEIDSQSGKVVPLPGSEIQCICEKAAMLEARQQSITPVDAQGYVLSEFARKQANRYLWDHLGMHYGATAPLFLPDESPIWQVTIVFSLYELGPFSVGSMTVEAQSGEPIPLTKSVIKQIKERVYAIIGPQTSSTNPAGALPGVVIGAGHRHLSLLWL